MCYISILFALLVHKLTESKFVIPKFGIRNRDSESHVCGARLYYNNPLLLSSFLRTRPVISHGPCHISRSTYLHRDRRARRWGGWTSAPLAAALRRVPELRLAWRDGDGVMTARSRGGTGPTLSLSLSLSQNRKCHMGG
jgi:hypothetical protein